MHTRILIADRQDMFREALKRLLDHELDLSVIADTGEGDQVAGLVSNLNPDLLLLDIRLRKRAGIEVLREISAFDPKLPSIVLTDHIGQSEIAQILLSGARGLVLKNVSTDLLLKCIRTVRTGQYWISHGQIAELVLSLRSLSSTVDEATQLRLSPQELQVVKSIVVGYSNKEIAEELRLSERTVKYHLSRIFEKFGVSGRMELARFSLKNKVVREA